MNKHRFKGDGGLCTVLTTFPTNGCSTKVHLFLGCDENCKKFIFHVQVQRGFSQCWTILLNFKHATTTGTRTHKLRDIQMQAVSCQHILYSHNVIVCLIWILTPVTSDPIHVNIKDTHNNPHTHTTSSRLQPTWMHH